ncbi:hypothetical protein [Aminobacter niigataensis]|uniref:hypothetical protein n=1 Tax=Aminobacter niigataensis TaxID=83265 RepID=UPI0024C90D56|nr:hypothetical protein [Aminobacter niigataensis]CAI2936187.1 conserved protein of unknown function [Aminobacter niigataensis]
MLAEANELLGDDQTVARCAIFPQFVPKDGPATAFDHTQLIYFRKDNKGQYAVSVGWRGLLPENADVHDFGCRQAANNNARKAGKLGRDPEPIVEATHYLGYYDLSVIDAKAASDKVYDVFVELVPENGEDAHSHVVLNERESVEKNTPKVAHRTQIVDELWRRMAGPERWLCLCDEPHRNDLEAVILPLQKNT